MRKLALRAWVWSQLPQPVSELVSVAGDASFRRYFRVTSADKSFIAMDAPPGLEDCYPFVAIAKAFQQTDVRLPFIFSCDITQGFLLLSDFGDRQLLSALNEKSANALYSRAMQTLLHMQRHDVIPNHELPYFTDVLWWREFEIFFTWYVKKQLHKTPSESDEKTLRMIYQTIIDSAAEQSTVFVHRDYHSRNIMLCEDDCLGILDFQDAVWGPITYDLVSLLKDCYIAWPQMVVEKWVKQFYENLLRENKLFTTDFQTFLRWFDWMGVQRHLKCLGIFSRLNHRDQKPGYLKDIPRVLNHAISVCDRYPELSELKRFLI